MGIEPLEPGFDKILIQPRLTSLKWARIRVPTIRGSLSVQLDNDSCYRLEIDLPPDTTARIGMPLSAPDGPANVLLDGKLVEGTVTANTVFIDGVGPGRHTLVGP